MLGPLHVDQTHDTQLEELVSAHKLSVIQKSANLLRRKLR